MNIEFVETQEEAVARAGVLGLAARPGLVWEGDADGFVASLGAGFERALERAGFKGEAGQSCSYDTGSEHPHTVVALGIGEDSSKDALRRAAGILGRKASKEASVATTLALGRQAAPVVEGFLLSQYSYDRFRSKPEPARTDSLLLVGAGDGLDCEAGVVVAEAVSWARDLVNTPAQDKAPREIQRRVAEMVEGLDLRLETRDVPDLEEGGFGGLLGVAAGSDRDPCLLELWYEPEGSETFVALVGKGITFDSGGLSIKPARAMETMKTDMSGAAAVIGAMVAIARLRLPVKVLGLAPFTDNMPGPRATKPGDVLTTRNGKTIEVLNTDAEGRLILADALAYAVEHGPDLMVDLATLTGACKVALGDTIAGVMGNDDSLIDRIVRAGEQAGESMWHLPLPEEYRRQLNTPMADMKNIGGRWGGALTAALLLQEFVGDVPWAHLDIAGPARWTRNEHYQTKGGSGFGVRTLVELAANLAEQGFGTTE